MRKMASPKNSNGEFMNHYYIFMLPNTVKQVKKKLGNQCFKLPNLTTVGDYPRTQNLTKEDFIPSSSQVVDRALEKENRSYILYTKN